MTSEQHDSSSEEKRPQFGKRFLTEDLDVFGHNAWDDVSWTEEQIKAAEEKIKDDSLSSLSEEKKRPFIDQADEFWNQFYGIHKNRFFKDRHWLFTEFPELLDNNVKKILEVGCGSGSTVFPILTTKEDLDAMVFCCDFSAIAIDLLKNNELYDSSRCHAFVYDITQDILDFPFDTETLDAIICIFTLSACNPDKFDSVIRNLVKFLKPGGLFLFRDYGRFDLAQMRFKKNACLKANHYVRGDGTTAYFFQQEEVDKLLSNAGLVKKALLTDRRLQVNRGKKLKMYRVWIQAKYEKSSLKTFT